MSVRMSEERFSQREEVISWWPTICILHLEQAKGFRRLGVSVNRLLTQPGPVSQFFSALQHRVVFFTEKPGCHPI